jgi:hypothetical protein
LQLFGQENAVFANEFAVEPYLAATPFLALNQDHVPVNRALVAVAAILVGLAGGEMQ